MYKKIFEITVPYRMPGDPTLTGPFGQVPYAPLVAYFTTPPRIYGEEFTFVNAILVKKEDTPNSPTTITLNVMSSNIYFPSVGFSMKFDGATGAFMGYGPLIGDSLDTEIVQSQDGSLWSTKNAASNNTELHELDPVNYAVINKIPADFFEIPADQQFHGIVHPMIDRSRGIIVMAGYPADVDSRYILVNNFATGALIRRIWVSGPVAQIMQEDDRRCFVICTNGIMNVVDFTTGEIISTTRTPVTGPHDSLGAKGISYAWDFALRRLLAFNFVDGAYNTPPINPDGSSSNTITGFYPVPLATNITKLIPLKPPRKGSTVPLLVRAVGDAGEPIASLRITASAGGAGTISANTQITDNYGYANIALTGTNAGLTNVILTADVNYGNSDVIIGSGTGGTGGTGGSGGETGVGGGPIPNVAPVLTLASGTQNGGTKASGKVTTDQATGFLFTLFSTNPIETQLNVRFGQSQPVNVAGEQSVAVTGLIPNTAYYPHFLHINANSLESAVATGEPFITALSDPIIGTGDQYTDLPDEGHPGATGIGFVNNLISAQFAWGDVYYKTPTGTYTLDSTQGEISHITERRIYTLNLNPLNAMPYAVGDFITIVAQPLTKTWTADGIQMQVALDEVGWTADMNASSYVYFHRVARVVPNSYTFEIWNIRPVSSLAELTRLMAMPAAWDTPPTGGIANVWRDTYRNYTFHTDARPRSYNGVLATTAASQWPGSPKTYGISPDLLNPALYPLRAYDVFLGDTWYKTSSGEWTTDPSQGTVSHITFRKRFKSWATLLRPGDVAEIGPIPASKNGADAPYKQWVAPDGSTKSYVLIEDTNWALGTDRAAQAQQWFEHVVRVVDDDYFEIWSALLISSDAELQAYLAMPTGWTANYVNMISGNIEFFLGDVSVTYQNPYPLSYQGVVVESGAQTIGGSGGGTSSGGISGGGTATQPVPAGGQIAPLSVENTSTSAATNQPFAIGHAFAPGHLPSSGAAIILSLSDGTEIPTQLNVKTTHADGSVRHAIVSGIIPSIAAGATVSLSMKRASTSASATPVGLPASLPSAMLSIGGVQFTATPTASTPYVTWFAGPVASDFVFNMPFVDGSGTAHPTLTAQFSVRAFATGHVRVDFVIEHCQAYHSIADITYDATLYMGGQPVYTRTGLVHTPTGRWKRTFWQGGKPVIHTKHDIPYLLDSKQVPNYDRSITIANTFLDNLTTALNSGNFDPMKFGRFRAYMPDYGGRPDIGLMPDSHAALLLSMDKRAWDLVMAAGDIGGSWPMCRRDDSTGPGRGYPLSVINFPYASLLGQTSDCNNPATGKNEHLPALTTVTTGVPDSSHQPDIYYLPYLLTGDYFYLEGLHFCCTFNHYQDNPYYRDFDKAHVRSDQLRGQGWSIRTMSECAAITPDDHYLKSHFVQWYNNNIGWYVTNYIDNPGPTYTNQLGVIVNGYSVSYNVNGGTSNGMAPWMDDFFTQALGHSYELLGHPDAKRLLLWKAEFQIGRMNDPAVCVQNACIYALGVRSTASSPFFSTLAECFDFSVPAEQEQYACGSAPRLALASSPCLAGDIDGYPASESGYPANYQPALAAAVDIGYSGGAQAWTKFMARPTKPDYGQYGAQFAVVPRTV